VVLYNEIYEKWNWRFREDRATHDVTHGIHARVLVGLMGPLVSGQVAAGYRAAKGKLVRKLHFLPIGQGQGSESTALSQRGLQR
jgi:hypothetical protein